MQFYEDKFGEEYLHLRVELYFCSHLPGPSAQNHHLSMWTLIVIIRWMIKKLVCQTSHFLSLWIMYTTFVSSTSEISILSKKGSSTPNPKKGKFVYRSKSWEKMYQNLPNWLLWCFSLFAILLLIWVVSSAAKNLKQLAFFYQLSLHTINELFFNLFPFFTLIPLFFSLNYI